MPFNINVTTHVFPLIVATPLEYIILMSSKVAAVLGGEGDRKRARGINPQEKKGKRGKMKR